MYVKVHKKGNQWFRIDTGTLVGTEISRNTSYYKSMAAIMGKRIIVRDTNNKYILVYRGYFSMNGKFLRLGESEKCSDKTCGFYVFVLA